MSLKCGILHKTRFGFIIILQSAKEIFDLAMLLEYVNLLFSCCGFQGKPGEEKLINK